MAQGFKLKIADIVFSILPIEAIKGFSLDKSYIPFKTGDKPEVVLRAVRKPSGDRFDPELDSGCPETKQIFSAFTWDYCQTDGRHIFNFSYSPKNNRPERRLVLAPDFKTGEIILPEGTKPQKGILQNPFSYPLDQLLMISLLPQMQGFLIHSCGFVYKNKGYLFVGSSGAGKSTMARILGKDKEVLILNDDRIVARKKNGCFYIYGTPWHGTEEIVSPEIAPLKGLFFLKKDKENRLQKISLSDAISRLIKCSFPPFWHREGIASTLKICEDIASTVPSFEFSFTPDNIAFNMIREEVL